MCALSNPLTFAGRGGSRPNPTIARIVTPSATARHASIRSVGLTSVSRPVEGPQAANVVGIADQTDLFRTMARALGVE